MTTVSSAQDMQEIKDLKVLFKVVNTTYTFLSSQRHIVTTFEVLNKAVRAQLKRDLTPRDLALVKALLPHDIEFGYVDQAQIETYADSGPFVDENGYVMKQLDLYNGDFHPNGYTDDARQILMFDFIDSKMTPIVASKRNSRRDSLRWTGGKLKALPVDQVTKMIKKREEKFARALQRFINSVAPFELVERMEAISEQFVPEPPVFTNPVTDMMRAAELTSIDKSKYSFAKMIDELENDPEYADQITYFDSTPEVPAEFGEIKLAPPIQQLLKSRGVPQLYSHQVEAITALNNGKHVVTSSATSSGKSYIYQLPVLEKVFQSTSSTAMFIFPTKALAQDQMRAFKEMILSVEELKHIAVGAFDGDTPEEMRKIVCEKANIVFTNPDIIHCSMLPSWPKWRRFLSNLRFVVIDELHTYSGLFGVNVAWVLRRLRRVCSNFGNDSLQFVACSATIQNPRQVLAEITGLEQNSIELIEKDGSPRGKKYYLMWETPYTNPTDESSGRVSPLREGGKLFVKLISAGVRTIVFCKVRRSCELFFKCVRGMLEAEGKTRFLSKIMSYRGGYAADDRRKIESKLFDGSLLGVIATNALELGVDIGTLDAVLVIGFPFSISNLRQQWGRVGRRQKESLAVLVGGGDAIDQHYLSEPETVFTEPNPEISLNLENLIIKDAHMQCAAFEIAIDPQVDNAYFGRIETNKLSLDNGSYHCRPHFLPWPAKLVAIRGAEQDTYEVIDTTNGRNAVIETIEAERISFTLYEGGIFMHQGLPFIVKEFNEGGKYAKVCRVNVDWVTRQRDFTDIDAIQTENTVALESLVPEQEEVVKACYGRIRHTMTVFGFFKIDKRDKIIDAVEVDMPPISFESKGFWIDVPQSALEIIKEKDLSAAGGVHGAQHAILSLLHIYSPSTPGDVGTECKAPEKEFASRQSKRRRPFRLIFYDAKGGLEGNGLTRSAFDHTNEIAMQALERVLTCDCENGCPNCVCSESCKEHSAVISKPAAQIILQSILGDQIDVDDISQGPEPNLAGLIHHESIIPV